MMTMQEYADGRLDRAPFLSINVSAQTMPQVMAKARYFIQRIAKNDATQLLQNLAAGATASNPYNPATFTGLSSTTPSHTSTYTPFDYENDRNRRVDELRTQAGYETFVNMPTQTQGTKAPFMFLGPVYLITANHPVEVPPLQPAPERPTVPDTSVPPEEAATASASVTDESTPQINIEFDTEMTTLPPPTQPYVYGKLFFPSMTKEGQPAPNYTFLGRSHRWMQRFLSSRQYVSRHPQCYNTCFGTPEYNMRGPMSYMVENVNQYYTSCGLHRDVPEELPEKPSPFPEYFFSVYELDTTHPEVAQYMHQDSPTTLTQSIMTTEIDWSIHCSSALISDNKQYFMVLRPFGIGIYRNEGNEDVLELCRNRRLPRYAKLVSGVSFQGKFVATKMTVDERFLSIFGRQIIYGRRHRPVGVTDEDIMLELRMVPESAQLPVAVVLGDDGTLTAYDRYNRPCTDPTFTAALSNDMTNLDLTALNDSTIPVDPNSQPYDAESDLQQRLLDLKNYLILMGIMQQDPMLAPAIESAQDFVRDLVPNSLYDSKADYRQRLYNLAMYLDTIGVSIPEELRPQLPSTLTDASSDTTPVPSINTSSVPLDTYDQRQDQVNRVVQLGQELGVSADIYFDDIV